MDDYDRLTRLSDEELAQSAINGERAAEDVLCTRYKNMVRRKARPYFLIGADREDIIQEGMIGLYKAIRDYNAGVGASFRAFAEICVHRQIITAVKASTRNKHKPLNSSVSLQSPAFGDAEQTLMDVFPLTAESPEDAFITKETAGDIAKGIEDSLSPLEKRALALYLEGRSYRESAQLLNCSPKTVDNALQRVKRKLSCYFSLEKEK